MRFASAFALLILALCLCAPLALTRAASADVLWDQLSASDHGFASQDFESAYDAYDCLAADDFEVPEPGWLIETVEFDVIRDGGDAPVHGIHIYIMPDRGDNLGDYENPVYYEYAPVDTVYDGTNTVTLTTPVVLPPGHYFFGAAPALDLEPHSQCFLRATTYAPVGQEFHMINPNGGFGQGSDWFQPYPGYDASFRLNGQILDFGFPDAVIDLPTEDATIKVGQSVEFAGTATDDDGYIVDWLWTFGEGSGIADMHVEDPGEVQFDKPGVFTVTFNAQDNDGNWDLDPDTRTVQVRGAQYLLYVDKNAPGPEHDGTSWDTAYLTIQQGVLGAAEGGEVWVADGTYVENVVMGEGVAIYGGFLGAEPGGYETELDQRDFVNNVTTIDGDQSGTCVTMAVDARVDGFTITNGSGTLVSGYRYGGGFYCKDLGESGTIANNTISGNTADYGGGAYCTSSSPMVTGNTITDCSADRRGGGLSCESSSSPTVTDNTITRNSGRNGGGGIQCSSYSSPMVTNNAVTGNSGRDGGGVYCYASAPTVTGNTITGNSASYGGGVYCRYHSSPSVTGNIITGNTADQGGGIYCADHSSAALTGNTITDNSATDYGGGVFCYFSSRPTVTNNLITGNSAGYGGGISCDDSSSPTVTVNTITGNSADSGGGVYCESSSSPTVTGNTITGNSADYGGGGVCCDSSSSPTVTKNVISGNSAYYGGGVYCYHYSSPGVTGNTITGNTADYGGGIFCYYACSPAVTDNTITGNIAGAQGGGICCYHYSSPAVTNNAVRENSAGYHGGGIFCHSSSPTVTNNAITENSTGWGGGGICCHPHSSPMVTNNTITGNSAGGDGGGIYCENSSPLVTNNTVTGNCARDGLGGGIFCYDHSSPTMTNNTITGNSAGGDGGGISCSFHSSPALTNNIVSDNSAGFGGALYCHHKSMPTVTNNTFWGNSAASGAALACDSAQQQNPSVVLMANCILWNGGDEVWNNDGSTITITYSDVQDGWPGEGNIDADPLFVHPEGGNWHLSFGSPCIDAGTNYAPDLPELDWEGEPRVYDGDGDEEEYGVYATVDMGADEFVPFVAEAPDPQPEADGPLFGLSKAGFPAWVWFSIPIDPDSCCNGDDCYDPAMVLGFPVSGHLWRWDKYNKFAEVYQAGFVEWDLAVGEGYLLFLWTEVPNPSYLGISPFTPFTFEHRLGKQGWTWIGMPGLSELAGDDFMASVKVKYPCDETGAYRTSHEDYEAIPDNWVTWGWPFWNTWRQGMETFTPYAPFGHRTCYPWLGYRVWVKVGTAQSKDDPDQVTLIWPKR